MDQFLNNDESISTTGPRPLATKPVYSRRHHSLNNGIIESSPNFIAPRKEYIKYTSFKRPVSDTLVQPNAKHGRKIYRSMIRDRNFLTDIKHVLRDKLAKLKEEQTILQDMLNFNEEDTQNIPSLFDNSPLTYDQQQSDEFDQDNNNALQFILSQLENTVSLSATPITEYTSLSNLYNNRILGPSFNDLSSDLRRSAHIESILGHDNNINDEITDFERLEYVLNDYPDNDIQLQENENGGSINNIDNNSYYNEFKMIVNDDEEEEGDKDEENDDNSDDDNSSNDDNSNDNNSDDGDGDGDNNQGIEDDESARQALSLLIAKYGI